MKRFLITTGPTREYIDTVRFLSNAATGRTGFDIAREAVARGHGAVVIAGPTFLEAPAGVRLIPVTTAEEMAVATMENLADCDVVVASAAVSDWRPEKREPHKVPKGDVFDLRLVKTVDIMELVGRNKGERLLIGFALEDKDARGRARAKIRSKNLDYIVVNGPENMGTPAGTYDILSRDGRIWSIGYLPKTKLAALLVSLAVEGEKALAAAKGA